MRVPKSKRNASTFASTYPYGKFLLFSGGGLAQPVRSDVNRAENTWHTRRDVHTCTRRTPDSPLPPSSSHLSPFESVSRFGSLVPASTRADPSIRGGRGSLTRRAIKAIRSVLSWNNVTLQRAGYVDKCSVCSSVLFSLSTASYLLVFARASCQPSCHVSLCFSLSVPLCQPFHRPRTLSLPALYLLCCELRVCIHSTRACVCVCTYALHRVFTCAHHDNLKHHDDDNGDDDDNDNGNDNDDDNNNDDNEAARRRRLRRRRPAVYSLCCLSELRQSAHTIVWPDLT